MYRTVDYDAEVAKGERTVAHIARRLDRVHGNRVTQLRELKDIIRLAGAWQRRMKALRQYCFGGIE